MVNKKIKSDSKKARLKSKAAHVGDLTDYVRGVRLMKANEKVLYSGSRGFLTNEHLSQQAEMAALAMEAVRSPNPLSHYLISWREGEQPTPEQVEEAVTVYLVELGLEDHQVIYGLHQDTDNIHLHIVVNRVHPESFKVIKPQKGFDIEAGHRAIARIEFLQGWQREANGRYQMLETGEVVRSLSNVPTPPTVSQRALDTETQTGAKSAERIGIEECAPIIRAAKSWAELHVRLAEIGARFEKKGSGGIILVSDIAIKASSVGRDKRDCSLGALQKRLGLFEPALVAPRDRLTQPIKPEAPRWDEYNAARSDHYGQKARDLQKQQTRHQADRRTVRDHLRAARKNALSGSWRGKGQVLNAMRSVIASSQAAELATLSEKQAKERAALHQRYPRFPSFEEWLRIAGDPELADAWRYRNFETSGFSGDREAPPVPYDIRAFTAEVFEGQVFYTRIDGGDPAFIDIGRRINVLDEKDETAVLAAMQLAVQKWGIIQVNGNNEYQALCVRLAMTHGFRLANPDLQQRVEAARRQPQPGSGNRSWRAVNRVGQARGFPLAQVADPQVSLYRNHFNDIAGRQVGKVDLSRIDSMIAVRLRATSHPKAEIEAIIKKCAPMIRASTETRDWSAYAARTARFAFGVEGTQKVQQVAKFRKQWSRLEQAHPDVNRTANGPPTP